MHSGFSNLTTLTRQTKCPGDKNAESATTADHM